MQKTKIEIIDETVEYYKKHKRAINLRQIKNLVGVSSNVCSYQTEDGRVCAHSRCLTDEGRLKVLRYNNSASADSVLVEFGDNIHKEEYRGHDVEFWRRIQKIHDTDIYWNDKNLSVSGQEYVDALKEEYKKE